MEEKKENSEKAVLILIIVVLLLIIGGLCWYIYSTKSIEQESSSDILDSEEQTGINISQENDISEEIFKPENTFNNTSFGYMMVKKGDKIYYTDENTGLFKFNLLNKERTTLVEGYISRLNIIEDSLYYLKTILDDEGYEEECNLYRMDLKDKKETVIKRDMLDRRLIVNETGIYYIEYEVGICKMGLDGKNDTVVVEGNIMDMLIQDNWIYYTEVDNGISNLYKVKTNGTKKSDVLYSDNRYISCLSVTKDEVLYITTVDYDEREIALTRIYNGEEKIISGVNGWDIRKTLIINDSIYTLKGADVYRYDLEGNNMTRIIDGSAESLINIVDSYIYYIDKDLKPYLVNIDGTGKIKL